MDSLRPKPATRRSRGVVAVVFRDDKLLMIRRSMTVTAPGMICLPGGTIESGETEPDALVREMQEELSIDVSPVKLCWRSVTAWGTNLAWWHAELPSEQTPIPNPEEVAEFFWYSRGEIRTAADVLPSLPEFVTAWDNGKVNLDQIWQ